MTKGAVAKKSTTTKHKKTGSRNSSEGTADMKILNMLAAHKVKFQQDSVEKEKVGGLAKIPGSSTVRNALAKLRKKEWIEVTNGLVQITALGMQHANVEAIEIPTSNEDHQAKVKESLNPKQVQLFDLISDGLPNDKEAVRVALGFETNSTWRNFLAALKKQRIIEEDTKTTIQLTKNMFPVIPRPELE
jgi:hypothetical protein